MDEKTKQQLILLAKEIYQEGYQCGIRDDCWFDAWAQVMFDVAHGAEYTQDSVIDAFESIKKGGLNEHTI